MAHHPLSTTLPPQSKQLLSDSLLVSSLYKWKINGLFHTQTHNAIMWYKHMHAHISKSSFQCLILQVTPTPERPSPDFQPNTPRMFRQGEDAIQNCTCQWCSDVWHTQAGPPTWYPLEQHAPSHI